MRLSKETLPRQKMKTVSSSRLRRQRAFTAIFAPMVLFSTNGILADPLKLNGTLAVGGSVGSYSSDSFRISPSGLVVYRADEETDEVFELWKVDVAGGPATKVNPNLTAGGDVDKFELTPDGTRVIYTADQDSNDVFELYSVSLLDGSTVKLSQALALGEDVGLGGMPPFLISADGTRVVYRAGENADFANNQDLFSVSINGGASVKLSTLATFSGGLYGYEISPNGARVVMRLADSAGYVDLYSIPIDGGSLVKLNGTLPFNADVDRFLLSDDSSTVIYQADEDSQGRLEIYSVPIEGGLATKLNGTLGFGSVSDDFAITPDGQHVLYRAVVGLSPNRNLYAAPISGGVSVHLSRPMDESSHGVIRFYPDPASDRVAYVADVPSYYQFGVYSVRIDGTSDIILGDPADGPSWNARVAKAGGYIFFQQQGQMVRTSFDGTDTQALGTPSDYGYQVSDDGERVVYRGYSSSLNSYNSLSLLDFGSGTEVSLVSYGNSYTDVVPNFETDFFSGRATPRSGCLEFTPDGKRVVYRADANTDSAFELFSIELGASEDSYEENDSSATAYDLSASEGVWLSDLLGHGVQFDSDWFRFSAPAGQVVRVEADFDHGGGDLDLRILDASFATVAHAASTNDNERACFFAPVGGDFYIEVSTPRSDPTGNTYDLRWHAEPPPSTGISKLSDPLVLDGDVVDLKVTPDGSRIVYIADQLTDGVYELFSKPTNGGPAVRLNASPAGASSGVVLFSDCQISPDGSQVAYRLDQDSAGVYELFLVPITGGTPQKLSGTLPSNGDVQGGFRFTPDGGQVVYRADQAIDDVVELYRTPVTGGATVKVNEDLSGNDDVQSFMFSPDGSTLVYRVADFVTSNFEETDGLYTVPLTGGSPTHLTETNGTLFDRIIDFGISLDSSRVVYIKNQDDPGKYELFSSPISGGSRVKISGTLPTTGDVSTFQFAPDGIHVVYAADLIDEQTELFRTEIGTSVVGQVSDPLVSGGDVIQYVVTKDARVIYTADQDTDGVYELFGAPLVESFPSGGNASVRISGTMVTGGNVSQFEVSEDGSRVTYVADQQTDQEFGIYAAVIQGPVGSISTSGPAVMLNPPGSRVSAFGDPAILPDGNRVLFTAADTGTSTWEAFLTDIDASSPARLNASLPVGSVVPVTETFGWSANGAFIAYRAEQDTPSVVDAYGRSLPVGMQIDGDIGEIYMQGFEAGIGIWSNATDGEVNWVVNSGPTGSSGTGPDGAGEGTYYLYVEASSPNYPGKAASLEADFSFEEGASPSLQFLYHMFGVAMGQLSVDVRVDGIWDLDVWSVSGQQHASSSDPWTLASVDLSAYAGESVTLRFRGVTGSSFESDIAIDAIELTGVAQYPEIVVRQPVATSLTDGSSQIDFGATVVGGTAITKTFTIVNAGTADLSGLEVALDGAAAGSFAVDTIGMVSMLEPGAGTSFTVSFMPSAEGLFQAQLQIASNDPDEAPFDIELSGRAVGLDGAISLFSDGTYVDLGGEVANTRASLENLGFAVVPFVGTTEADWNGAFAAKAVVVPELENGSPVLSSAAMASISVQLESGKGLVVMGSGSSNDEQFLNSLLGWSLVNGVAASAGSLSKSGGVNGFAGSPSELQLLNATYHVATASLPAGATAVYASAADTAVFVQGSVAYLGYDWFAGPNPDWEAVLGDAIAEVAGDPPFFDDFDPNYDPALWAAFGGTAAANTNGQAAGPGSSGNSLWFGGDGVRSATTIPIDTTGGGSVSFKLAVAAGFESTWETADLGEEVVLEWSTDGIGFTQFAGPFSNTDWQSYEVSIPLSAESLTTQIRFRQLGNSGTGYDHWAIEDVAIFLSTPGSGGAFEAAAAAAGLTGVDALRDAIPFGDGIPNLVKFAFNMNLSGPDVTRMHPGGFAGLPHHSMVEDGFGGWIWRIEYVRRTDAGLIYTPERSLSLAQGSFSSVMSEFATETVQVISAGLERVIIEDPFFLTPPPAAFWRVRIDG